MNTTTNKSVIDEAKQIGLAIELIELGARLQVLQTETDISRRRLINLYKEIHGVSPPKGMLPFSTDWYVTWLPNIHSSLFYNTYCYLRRRKERSRMEAVVNAYRLYNEQTPLQEDGKPVLSLTRAWMLVRFFESDMMMLSVCNRCKGKFVNRAYSLDQDFVCGICQPPSRAGKTLKKTKSRKPKE
ncbi:transcriptional activator FlhC [Salinisphaera shabanensis T35B1]|jgi:flagellar transcriptional activator FlhC|uniref:Flagellar transcriptional regulator FlhC n=1 Tax=Salinisphaera shabanensis E1L3A TaxID=1033802 RepID=F7Q521_9GAMM|nr:flagellar transcriptional regulator FlhC [Salinisphaera shabanensis]ERJ19049.1 Flagellar transcriptional regulator FlhC protein [Salinisphaera shabanensis E1L3A]